MTENREQSLTIGILGVNHKLTDDIGKIFGAPGTQSDLMFYNRLDLENKIVFTCVVPISYPDKLKSLLQTCMLNRIITLAIDLDVGITPEIGEIMLTMALFKEHFKKECLILIGNITSKNEWNLEETIKKVSAFIEPTKLKGTPIITLVSVDDPEKKPDRPEQIKNLKEKVIEIGTSMPPLGVDYGKVLVDHVFNVKGIGTVVLGLVKGNIEAGKMYEILPVKEKGVDSKKIVLRSIQIHDRDFKLGLQGDRVGLALKGIKAEDIDRNTLLTDIGICKLVKDITIKLDVLKFYKPQQNGAISPKNKVDYHLISNLGVTPIDIVGGDDIKPNTSGKLDIKLKNHLAQEGANFQGILAYFEPFQGRLRIVGYFTTEN